MKFIQKVSVKITAFTALFLLPLSAIAGLSMTISSSSLTEVPTLTGTMLIVLSLLLFAVAVRVAKQKNSGVNEMFVTLLGVGSLSLVTGGGMQIVSKADAAIHGAAALGFIGSINGISIVQLDQNQAYNLFTNNNLGVVVTIVSISSQACGAPPYEITSDINGLLPTPKPTCTVGSTVNFGGHCELWCDLPLP